MIIRCSRCGCVKFFYTSPNSEKVDSTDHHGACCAKCYKPLDLNDLVKKIIAQTDAEKSYAQ